MGSNKSNHKEIIEEVRKVGKRTLGKGYEVFIFGSVAREDFHNSSDLDLGIMPNNGNLEFSKLLKFRSALEDTKLPFEFDVVDFSRVSKDFAKEASKSKLICLGAN